MEKQALKEKIITYVRQHPYTSFAELSNAIEDFKGNYVVELRENLCVWNCCSEVAADAITDLLNDKVVEPAPTTALTYMVDGLIPQMPLAKSLRAYKKPHWLPITLSIPKKNKLHSVE